jgi:DNA-binding PadR family transcriptional regulator
MNRNKKFAFNVQLAILGFLMEKDFYGYELKKFMERFMGPWSDIKFGSIYYALEKLTQDGLVQPAADAPAGAQPERAVYRITEKGRQVFLQMLDESLTALQQIHFLLDVSLFFAGNLPHERVAELLRQRAEKVDQLRQAWAAIREGHEGNDIAQLLIEHGLAHLETEHEFLRKVADRFAAGNPFATKSLRRWLEEAPTHRPASRPHPEIE